MGAWSADPLGNDTALDWLGEFCEAPSLEAIEAKFAEVMGESDYLDADVGFECLAACEVVVRAMGKGTSDGNVEEVDAWIAEAKPQVSPALAAAGAEALRKVLGDDSEVVELWEGDPEFEKASRAVLERLEGSEPVAKVAEAPAELFKKVSKRGLKPRRGQILELEHYSGIFVYAIVLEREVDVGAIPGAIVGFSRHTSATEGAPPGEWGPAHLAIPAVLLSPKEIAGGKFREVSEVAEERIDACGPVIFRNMLTSRLHDKHRNPYAELNGWPSTAGIAHVDVHLEYLVRVLSGEWGDGPDIDKDVPAQGPRLPKLVG